MRKYIVLVYLTMIIYMFRLSKVNKNAFIVRVMPGKYSTI